MWNQSFFFGHAFLFNLPLQRNRDIPRLARLETRRIYFFQVSLCLSLSRKTLCVIRIKTTRKETKRGARSQIYENKGETERFDSINAAYNLFFFLFSRISSNNPVREKCRIYAMIQLGHKNCGSNRAVRTMEKQLD